MPDGICWVGLDVQARESTVAVLDQAMGEVRTKRVVVVKHRLWLASIRFVDQASRATLADHLHAHDVLICRRDRVEAELAKLALAARCAPTVARLGCLRGIDTLTALGLCAEIGEFERFDHPDQLAS